MKYEQDFSQWPSTWIQELSDRIKSLPKTYLPSGCILHPGDRYKNFNFHGMFIGIHRCCFASMHGYFPPVVMHSCDNPRCINPEHLIGGTQKQNMEDCKRKNRNARGRTSGVSKRVSRKKIMEIRGSTLSRSLMAKKYGLSTGTIERITNGTHWCVRDLCG